MEVRLNEFYARLKHGPAFLLLGQNYLRLETGVDPFLSEVLRKYGPTGVEKADYYQILDSGAASSVESALAWMDERCKRFSVPEWLRAVASYPWSGVYTSAIDSVWPACFRTSWREIHPLFEEKYKPSDPRNRFVLHCTFMFGCVNRTEEEERPPLKRFEWMKRKQVAVALARRLPEVVTPMGTLVIEGYAGNSDWLSLDDLLPILDCLNPGQAYLFSVARELLDNPYVKQLAERGKLTLLHESLAATVLRGEALGLLRLGRPPEEEEHGQRIRLEDKVLSVPREIWSQVSRSALILDDTVLIQPPPLSEDARYREFRNFLSVADGKPQWPAHARGFAFRRHFEKMLRREVERRLGVKHLIDEPVILHGQAGTGKTVALGALAYTVRVEGKYPVLFIERRTQRPLPSDIDRFCQWAEDSGAPACLVVWDGMVDQEEYSEFLRYLTSRGRKVVLVGSCYRIADQYAKGPRFILAEPRLSQSEIEEFAAFLRAFHPSLDQILSKEQIPLDDTFLVALYRLLPPTRSLIRAGVSREVGHAEQLIARKANETPTKISTRTALAEALFEAGLISQEELFSPGIKEVGGETVDDIQALTGLVMVPGRFGLRVPLELLLRPLGNKAYSNFARLFEGVDVFRWFEDALGNIEVGARSALEARLLVQSRMGGAKTETGFAMRLLLEVQEVSGALSDGREIRFAVDLVRHMGDQGQEREYFAPYFRDLSTTLRQLRQERGVENPRLMLQEAHLLREWSIEQARRGVSNATVDDAFKEVEVVLSQALGLVGSERKNRALRNALLVELASALAAKTQQILNHTDRRQEAIRFYKEARKALLEARVQEPTNYYPIDVLAWATRDMVLSKVLDQQSSAEAVADVLHAFQTADPQDFDSVQQEKFRVRQVEFNDRLGNQELAQEAFDALLAQGSSAGYYLRARLMSGLPETLKNLETGGIEPFRRALGYLEEHREAVSRDGRCLDLLLDLWWMIHTKMRLFDRERATLPLSDAQWRQCLDIIRALEATGQSHRPTLLAFLRGLGLFHIGDVSQALEVFREVQRESDQVRGRRRIIRSYLASTPAGQPRKYHGDVAWVSNNGFRGAVYVEELRRQIAFIPRDFGRPDINQGDTLGEFHVAFNFLGPIADPPGYYRP